MTISAASLLTPTEREKMSLATCTLSSSLGKAKIYAKKATLQMFGFQPDSRIEDLSESGKTLNVRRRAHTRARWLGDTTGTPVKESNATIAWYPSRRGTALPGDKMLLMNMTTGKAYPIHVVGESGNVLTHLIENRNTFAVRVWSKGGSKYEDEILSEADYNAANPLVQHKASAPTP